MFVFFKNDYILQKKSKDKILRLLQSICFKIQRAQCYKRFQIPNNFFIVYEMVCDNPI